MAAVQSDAAALEFVSDALRRDQGLVTVLLHGEHITLQIRGWKLRDVERYREMSRDVQRCRDVCGVVGRCCSGSCSAQWLGSSLRCPWTPCRQGEFKQICPSKLETLNTLTEFHVLWSLWICVDSCCRKQILCQGGFIPHSLSTWFWLKTPGALLQLVSSFPFSGDSACCRG